MWKALEELVPAGKPRAVVLTAGGLAALVGGNPPLALASLGQGLLGLERAWRTAHPEFRGGWRERLAEAVRSHEATHHDPTGRALLAVGAPLALGGAAGLFVLPPLTPPWTVSAAVFGAGCALLLVGHAVFENGAPGFSDDPLAFVVGPLRDLPRLRALVSQAS